MRTFTGRLRHRQTRTPPLKFESVDFTPSSIAGWSFRASGIASSSGFASRTNPAPRAGLVGDRFASGTGASPADFSFRVSLPVCLDFDVPPVALMAGRQALYRHPYHAEWGRGTGVPAAILSS